MQVCRCKLKPTVYPSCGKNVNTLLYLVAGMGYMLLLEVSNNCSWQGHQVELD